MRKSILTLALLHFVVFIHAQKTNPQVEVETKMVEIDNKFLLSFGIEFSLPVGEWKESYGMGLGAEIQGKFRLNKNIDFITDAGYIRYAGKDVGVGGSYKLDPKHHIYLAPGLEIDVVKGVNGSLVLQTNVGVAHTTFAGASDNSTVLLGGLGYEIYRRSDRTPTGGIPFLTPMIRFRNFGYADKRRSAMELLIIITPSLSKGSRDE